MNLNLERYVNDYLNTATDTIVATLNASHDEWKAYPLDDLESFLLKAGLKRRLLSVIADEATPDIVKAGLQDFLDLLSSVRLKNLSTDQTDVQTKFSAIVGYLLSIDSVTDDEKASLAVLVGNVKNTYTLAGRLLGQAATADMVNDAKLRVNLRKELAALYGAAMNLTKQPGTPPATLAELLTAAAQ